MTVDGTVIFAAANVNSGVAAFARANAAFSNAAVMPNTNYNWTYGSGKFSATGSATGNTINYVPGPGVSLATDTTNNAILVEGANSGVLYTNSIAGFANVSWAGLRKIVLNANAALTNVLFTGGVADQQLVLEVRQDATGSRLITFDSNVVYGTDITAAPTLTTTANLRDFIGFFCVNTKYMMVSTAKGYP